jgi:hypothetical protein
MTDINYYCYSWRTDFSGGSIFDRNLANALKAAGEVHEHAVSALRKWTVPVWKKRIDPVLPPKTSGINIVSHEGLHDIVDTVRVDCFIVHNYFPAFDFEKLKFMNPMYRLCSDKVFSRIFAESGRIVFLSSREKRLATEKYPELAGKFLFAPPGHNENTGFREGDRDPEIVEMPGTLDWLPKRLSFWLNVGSGLPGEGTLVRGDSPDAYVSVVYDSFLSGFKLKLIEMAKHGKSIISFCDLKEELVSTGFEDLPYIKVSNRSELKEAIEHFRKQGDVSQEHRREYYRRGCEISWTNLAKTVLGA